MRSLRNLLYFFVGFMLAINAGLASAWIAHGDGYVITRDSSGRPVTIHYTPDAGTGVQAQATHPRTVSGGAVAVESPVTTKQKISKPAVANLAKRVAKGLVPGVGAAVAASMLVDAGLECLETECYRRETTPDPWQGISTIAATYGTRDLAVQYKRNGTSTPIFSTRSAVCANWGLTLGGNGVACVSSAGFAQWDTTYGCPAGQGLTLVNGTNVCRTAAAYYCPSNGGWILQGSSCHRTACTETEYRNESGQCVSAAMTDSEVDAALQSVSDTQHAADFVDAVSDAGIPIPADNPVTSGPASVTSDPLTKTEIKDGQTLTTTTTTTVNNTYNQNTVNTTVTNNSTTVNSSGAVVNQTSEQVPQRQDEVTVVTDSSLSDIPELYERKYPDGLAGVWNDRKAELMATPLFSLSAVFTPNISAGSCPSWGLNFNIGAGMNYGMATMDVPCWVFDVIKAIIIISALLLARRLIFGG